MQNLKLSTIILSIFIFVSTYKLANCQLADSPWPKFRHDLQNTGRSPYYGPQKPDTIWTYNTKDKISASPTIGIDGTIYIGSELKDSKFRAINPNGTDKAFYHSITGFHSSAAIGSDSTIFVGGWDNYLYSFNKKELRKNWEFETNDDIYSSPTIGLDGVIYIASWDDSLYAINCDGSLKWVFGHNYTASALFQKYCLFEWNYNIS